MKNKTAVTRFSALRITASLFGVLSGLGGITHGIGEVMQGNTATDGIWIYSWAQGPIATNMGGEPGITIVPNFLITGVLCLAVSLAVITWATALVQRKMGGTILIGLSIVMLLVGGGVGPPLIGILAGVAGTGVNSPLTWWRSHLPVKFRQFLAKLWPWVFGLCTVSGVLLVVGSVILVYFFDVNNPEFFTNNFYFTVLALIIAILTGVAHDIQVREEGGTKK